jgi:hypothetical protein
LKISERHLLSKADLSGTASQLNTILEQNPELFPEFFRQMLQNTDSMIRLRIGNAVEKAARKNPELIRPYKNKILTIIPNTQDTEIIWHVVLLLGYLDLEEDEQALAVNTIYRWLDTIPHRFVKVNCLQTLGVLAQKHDWLRGEVTETLQAALEHESPSIRARSRILLKQLSRKKP